MDFMIPFVWEILENRSIVAIGWVWEEGNNWIWRFIELFHIFFVVVVTWLYEFIKTVVQ